MKDNNGKPIYFDSIDNSAYILGKSTHSARKSWIYVNGEYLNAIRVDIGGDPKNAMAQHRVEVHLDCKGFLARTEPGARFNSAVYNLTMDPFERYDMIFNGAEGEMNGLKTSPGRYAGEDNGWTAGLFSVALMEFDKSIMKYPSIQRFPGGASNDLIPNLQHPKNPLPLVDPQNLQSRPFGG